jgi:hypothetical protein
VNATGPGGAIYQSQQKAIQACVGWMTMFASAREATDSMGAATAGAAAAAGTETMQQ